MQIIKFSDAVLNSLCGKTSEDFAVSKTTKFKSTIVGLTDCNIIYGAHKNRKIPGSLFPYVRFDLERNIDMLTAVKAQTIRTYFEIGLDIEREANSNIQMAKYLQSFKKWLKANKILKLDNEIITAGMVGGWEIEFQYGINAARETVDQRFAVLRGGWVLLSEDDEDEML